MTKKEAIEIIKSECYIFNPFDFDKSTRINTALDMAIKALKAMNQIYKITVGYAESLYQSETTFDGVANILTDYFKEVE